MLLLRQLSQVMRQASAAGGFFDAWMKHNSDLVQGAANAFAGKQAAPCFACGAVSVEHFPCPTEANIVYTAGRHPTIETKAWSLL